MNHRFLVVGAAAWVFPAVAPAQRTNLSLDLGTARMRYADSIDATAVSASPSLRLGTRHATLDASGTLSRLSGAWSNSGTATGVLSTPFARQLSMELGAATGGSAHSDGARTGQFLGLGRIRFDAIEKGMWFGAGAGRTWDGAWHPMRQGEFGGWLAREFGSAVVTVMPTVVADTVKYTDLNIVIHRGGASWDLDLSLGARAGSSLPSLPANRKAWGSGAGTLWLSPRIGVVASGGTYPVDFTQGFPGGRFVSLSLRIAPGRSMSTLVPIVGDSDGSEILALEVRRLERDAYHLRVLAPRAHSVDLAGDFTHWDPVALRREADGWFQVAMTIPPGSHEVNVRLDSGSWRVPPGLTALKDEFGGAVGFLTVP